MSRSTMTPRSFSTDQLRSALRDIGGQGRPDDLADIVALAGRTRQRPRWTLLEWWLPVDIAPRRQGVPRVAVALATLLLLALLAAGVYVGARPNPTVDLGVFEPVARPLDCRRPDGLAATILGCTSDDSRVLIQKGDLDLFVVDTDGSETRVTEGRSELGQFLGSARPAGATISPDGSRVVFAGLTRAGLSCHNGALFAVDGDGGPAELLWRSIAADEGGIVRYPTFSPDGTRIAFADGYCDHAHIVWVMNADGSDPQQILVAEDVGLGAGHVYGLAWSPNGDRLALKYERGWYTFAPDGSDLRLHNRSEFYCWPGRRC